MPAVSASSDFLSAPAPDTTIRPYRIAIFCRPHIAWLVFLVVVLAVYAPALGGRFLWDDDYLAQSAPLIRSPLFCLEAFRHTLFNGASMFYRPTQTLTYIFDYWCWGPEPFGYHLTNILIHALNGFGLFLLLRRVLPVLVPTTVEGTTPRPATDHGALAIALLWTLHPVHSAAVAYVSGRADSLAMVFCLGAWLACERALDAARPTSRAGWAVAAFISLLLGLCSKEIAFVWLVLFGCWLFALRPNLALRTKLAVAAGGLFALGCYLGLRMLPLPAATPPPFPVMPPRWVLMLRALGDYGRLMLFPDELYMERQVFAAPGLANPESPRYDAALTVLGAFVLAGLAVGAWLPGRGRALRRAGAVWFLVGFLPVSNLFLLNATVAEHWLYLPSVGFLMFVAGATLDVPWPRLSTVFARRETTVAAVLVLAAALGGRTWLRAHDWVDGMSFYQQTIRDGGDTPRMREGLALVYIGRGDLTKALVILGDLVARYPHMTATRVNLATVLARAGRRDEARAEFERVGSDLLATADARGDARVFTAVVHALDKLASPGDAAWAALRQELLGRVAGRFPPSWELVRLGIGDREKSGDLPEALALVEGFVAAHWWHAPARLETARLLAAAGRPDAALDAWRQAARFDIHDAEAPSAAATCCLTQGRLDEALAWQQTAVHRQPRSLRQHLLLARVFAAQGHTADADHERTLAAQLALPSEG